MLPRATALIALVLVTPAGSLLGGKPGSLLGGKSTLGAPRPRIEIGQSWSLGRIAFSLLPLAGSERRATLLTEVVPKQVWTFDQIQGVVNVNVPVRMTVIKLESGGLWVHNPVAPTGECLRL